MSTVSAHKYSSFGERMTGSAITRMMSVALQNPRLLSLAAGFTDNSTLPIGDLEQACQKLLGENANRPLLQYGTNQGRLGLREFLARRLALLDGSACSPLAEQVCITNGSQQALYLAMQVLCDPGDIVLVEPPTYFVLLEMLHGLGIEPVSLPQTEDGELSEEVLLPWLESLAADGRLDRVKAVYLVSYFSNPTGACRSETDKLALLSSFRKVSHEPVLIEDAAYRELFYNESYPARSFFPLLAEGKWPCLYLATLTKPYATGLKVGYGVSNDDDLLARMLCAKGHHDFGTAHFNQALLEEVLIQGALDKQLETLRSLYHQRMLILDQTLREAGLANAGWHWDQPEGGIYLWVQGPESLDTGIDSRFASSCLKEGVMYVPGELCYAEPAVRRTVRLSFGSLKDEELAEAGRRFARAAANLTA